MSPRPRARAILPGGIKPDALPAYVYWDRTGNGRWVWRQRETDGKLRTHRLGGPGMTLREIWDAWEALTRAPPAASLGDLVTRFESSRAWGDLAEMTRRDYGLCARAILATQTRAGLPLAQSRLADWTPGTVRAYVDKRAETSVSRANHELRYLRRLFAWGYERDLIAVNPASGVRTLRETPRARYVTDDEYASFLSHAGASYPYLIPVAELAYLCRLRIAEVCDLRRQDITDSGLYAARRKGSKDAMTGWTPRLRAAVDRALALHGAVASLYLIPGASRGRMAESTVQTAWQRAMVAWAAAGHARWTLHDLKRKGVSDVAGDKLAASGHRSAAMLRVYDVLPAQAPATREEVMSFPNPFPNSAKKA